MKDMYGSRAVSRYGEGHTYTYLPYLGKHDRYLLADGGDQVKVSHMNNKEIL